MTSLLTTSLFDLNEHCLLHLCSFLSIQDILQFHFACNLFHGIALNRLKTDKIVTSLFRNSLTREQINQIFTKFGPYIGRLHIDEWISPENIYFYKLLAKKCINVEVIDLYYPSRHALQIYADILSNAKSIKSIVVRPDELTHVKGAVELNKLETKLCSMINRLAALQVLQLSNLDDITGEELTTLSNLIELNIAHCYSFEQKHFLSLCEKNALKVVNVVHCLLLDNEALEKLSELESLTNLSISDNLLARNYDKIADIKNLRELNYHIYEAVGLENIVMRIVLNHKQRLEKLVIINEQLIANGVFTQIWPNVLSFENLKILDICVGQIFDNWHFVEIGKSLRKLEVLVLKFCDLEIHVMIINDLLEFLKFSRRIRRLTIYPHEFCTTLVYKSIRARVDSKTKKIQIDGNLASDYLIDSTDYATVMRINVSNEV